MRVLIIRFSSFGDIFQALEAAKHLFQSKQTTYVDWLVRSDFAPLLQHQGYVRAVHSFDRKSSVFDLVRKSWTLADSYDHVYDAHSNLRSFIVCITIRTKWFLITIRTKWFLITIRTKWFPRSLLGRKHGNTKYSLITRSKERVRRFLFFKFSFFKHRHPVLPFPYRGAESFVTPLKRWLPELKPSYSDVSWRHDAAVLSQYPEFERWLSGGTSKPSQGHLIALAPSAAWPNKRWPVERWRELVSLWLKESPHSRFLLLGGPDDRFLDEIEREFGSECVFNAVGKTSLLASASLLAHTSALVANDTGLLHVADRLQLPSVVIVGPTAFGYPVAPVSYVAEVQQSDLRAKDLLCKPCSKDGRDRCTNSVALKCLLEIDARHIIGQLKKALSL
ncbi:MAG: glycosyltransferase family 9 protein [Bdellovibrionales bacterium]|jgi:heptosyltransferase-2|nr:glycosyltransferase family 9 protein [Bdellovibrionales bacterium]